jgi:hypothetical protein
MIPAGSPGVADTDNRKRLSAAYVVAPCIALLTSAPAAMFVPPFHSPDGASAAVQLLFAMGAIPLPVGCLSAPGYVYAWSERWRGRDVPMWARAWIHTSLTGAVAASFLGTLFMLAGGLVLFAVLPAISGCLAIHVWRRFSSQSRARTHSNSA